MFIVKHGSVNFIIAVALIFTVFLVFSTNALQAQESFPTDASQGKQVFLPLIRYGEVNSSLSQEIQEFILTTELAHSANYPDLSENINTIKLYLEGQEKLNKGDYTSASAIFESGISLHPNSRYMHEGLASALYKRYESSLNIADLRLSIQEFVAAEDIAIKYNKSRYTYPIAMGYGKLGDLTALHETFTHILTSASPSYLIYLHYAQGLAMLRNPQAEEMFINSVNLQLDDIHDATITYAEWLLDNDRPEGVLSLEQSNFKVTKSTDSPFSIISVIDNPYWQFLQAVALERLGRLEEASEAYTAYQATGMNQLFPAPSRYKVEENNLQKGLLFDDQVKAAATETDAINMLSFTIACESNGEPTGAQRSVGWTVRTRVMRAYNVSSSCGGYNSSTNGVWGALASTASLPNKYVAIMQAPSQFWESCTWASRTSSTDWIAANVYNGWYNNPTNGYCPAGTLSGSHCSGNCTATSYTGASTTGPAWFVSNGAGCGPAGCTCAVNIGATCGNTSPNNVFYRIK